MIWLKNWSADAARLSSTTPSPSSHANTHSAGGETTHSFPTQARAYGDAHSCCVLWIKVEKDQVPIYHSPAKPFVSEWWHELPLMPRFIDLRDTF
jgi:hypothetical protein